jgi:hypothetical protein
MAVPLRASRYRHHAVVTCAPGPFRAPQPAPPLNTRRSSFLSFAPQPAPHQDLAASAPSTALRRPGGLMSAGPFGEGRRPLQ